MRVSVSNSIHNDSAHDAFSIGAPFKTQVHIWLFILPQYFFFRLHSRSTDSVFCCYGVCFLGGGSGGWGMCGCWKSKQTNKTTIKTTTTKQERCEQTRHHHHHQQKQQQKKKGFRYWDLKWRRDSSRPSLLVMSVIPWLCNHWFLWISDQPPHSCEKKKKSPVVLWSTELMRVES